MKREVGPTWFFAFVILQIWPGWKAIAVFVCIGVMVIVVVRLDTNLRRYSDEMQCSVVGLGIGINLCASLCGVSTAKPDIIEISNQEK